MHFIKYIIAKVGVRKKSPHDIYVPLAKFIKYLQHLLSLLSLLICGEAGLAQKPRLASKVPVNPLEPLGDWVWGKLINGFVYRARSSYGGDGGGKLWT